VKKEDSPDVYGWNDMKALEEREYSGEKSEDTYKLFVSRLNAVSRLYTDVINYELTSPTCLFFTTEEEGTKKFHAIPWQTIVEVEAELNPPKKKGLMMKTGQMVPGNPVGKAMQDWQLDIARKAGQI